MGGFNGNYVVTATVQATVGGSATPQTVTLDSPLTVDREDLLITSTTPANPTPLKWDPAANNGNPAPLTVSATLDSVAYKASGTATLKIYTSDPQNPNEMPVRTLTQPFTTTDGQVTFSWDGKGDPTTANGVPTPGPQQPKGLYLFQIFVSDTTGVSDTDKSSFLSLYNPAPTARFLSDNGTTQTDSFTYTLTSADSPAQAGSAGKIDVYDSTLNSFFSQPLQASDLTPGSHSVSVGFPVTQSGVTGFVLPAQDNDAGNDRGHRRRLVNHLTPIPLQITTQSLPNATVGVSYSQLFNAEGGLGPYSWLLQCQEGDILPPGLKVIGDKFCLAGTPTYARTYTFTVSVVDSVGNAVDKAFTLRVLMAPQLQITTDSLPGGTVASPYETTFQATGGYGLYTWSVVGSPLPEGLFISQDGLIGFPTEFAWGTAPFTIQVADESGQVAAKTFTDPISLAIAPGDDTGDDNGDLFFPWGWVNVDDTLALSADTPDDLYSPISFNAFSSNPPAPAVILAASNTAQLPPGHWRNTTTGVSYDIAFNILENYKNYGYGLWPRSRTGNTAWFVSHGSPGTGGVHPIKINAQVYVPDNHLVLAAGTGKAPYIAQGARDLDAMYSQNKASYAARAISQFNQQWQQSNPNIPVGSEEYNTQFNAWSAIEKGPTMIAMLWSDVSKLVADPTLNPSGVAEIHLCQTHFSFYQKTFHDGDYLVCADKAKMRISGGLQGFLDQLVRQRVLNAEQEATHVKVIDDWLHNKVGNSPSPVAQAALRKWTAYKITPKVIRVCRFVKTGFIVIQLTSGAYEIYAAKDKRRAFAKLAGGMTGAAFGAAFANRLLRPALSFGLIGRAIYGGGELGGSIGGFFAGEKAAGMAYDMWVYKMTVNFYNFMQE